MKRVADVGIVAIGRNEGERLTRCLESLGGAPLDNVVYVDSGSADASVANARQRGAAVVELDLSVPFSAARARNAGFRRLQEGGALPRYVQFVDGDCEITPGWLEFAAQALDARPGTAAVAGWLRERAPERSIYNRLGDLEWNFSGAGEVEAVGGIFMIRREAFEAVGGFDRSVAAGEEPELCQRLRRAGWRIERLDRDMARHDLAMTRFSQWWRRVVRFGHGSADVAQRFGVAKFRRQNARARAWAAWLALTVAMLGAALAGWAPLVPALVLLALWPAQVARIGIRTWRAGQPPGVALAYAVFTMLAFVPQVQGQLLYLADRVARRGQRLIEY